jgi:hypothetical protein
MAIFPFVPIIFLINLIRWLSSRPKRRAAQQEQAVARRERVRMAQEIAEKAERQLIADIVSGVDVPPFALYLRPFALEKVLRERTGLSLWDAVNPQKLLFHICSVKEPFDFKLQRYVSSLALPLISIGPVRYDNDGAAQVVATDFDWRDRFRHLAERAFPIIVIPGSQDGIVAEIRWLIVTGLLVNAIFFKPASYPKIEWEKVQELYQRQEDIYLPEYSRKQLTFRMYSSGKCHSVTPWNTVYRKGEIDRGNAQMRAILLNRPKEFEQDQ